MRHDRSERTMRLVRVLPSILAIALLATRAGAEPLPLGRAAVRRRHLRALVTRQATDGQGLPVLATGRGGLEGVRVRAAPDLRERGRGEGPDVVLRRTKRAAREHDVRARGTRRQ